MTWSDAPPSLNFWNKVWLIEGADIFLLSSYTQRALHVQRDLSKTIRELQASCVFQQPGSGARSSTWA